MARMFELEFATRIAASVEAVFAFHAEPDALARLMPPWDPSRVVEPPKSLEVGTRVVVETRVGPIRFSIVAVHTEYELNRIFVDEMEKGPFSYWRHEHHFEDVDGDCLLRDRILYTPRFGIFGRLAEPLLVRPRLRKLFEHRHQVTRAYFEA